MNLFSWSTGEFINPHLHNICQVLLSLYLLSSHFRCLEVGLGQQVTM